MTPRKSHPRQHHRPTPSLPTIQPSDYESEAPQFNAPPVRSNTDLNLSVLRRYVPSIQTILSIAPSAVLYNFLPATQTWDRAEIEGTLFVCHTFKPPAHENAGEGEEGYCVVVLNKRGLDNLIVDLREVEDVEVTSEFLILRWMEGEEGESRERVIGVFIHADKEHTRDLNCGLVREGWLKSRGEGEAKVQQDGYGKELSGEESLVGRRLDVNELFGQGRR